MCLCFIWSRGLSLVPGQFSGDCSQYYFLLEQLDSPGNGTAVDGRLLGTNHALPQKGLETTLEEQS